MGLSKPHIFAIGLEPRDLTYIGSKCKTTVVANRCGDRLPSKNNHPFAIHDVACILVRCDKHERSNTYDQINFWRQDLHLDAPIIWFDDENIDSIIDIMSNSLISIQKYCDICREMSELRRLHEDLQNSFAQLRDFYYREGLSIPRLLFENTCSEVHTSSDACSIDQRLPVDAMRLIAVGLFISSRPATYYEGNLSIEVLASEEDFIFGKWEIPFADIADGWNTFVMSDHLSACLRKNALLRVAIDAVSEGEAPAFAYGEAPLQPEMGALVNGHAQSRALALRCWTGLPGSRPSISTKMWPAKLEKGRLISRLEVIPEDDLQVRSVCVPVSMDFDVIKWDPDRRWILVHPVATEPTVAEIPRAILPGTTRISVEIETAHADAGPVDYAIALGNENKLSFEAHEWTRLPAVTSSSIVIDVSPDFSMRSLFLLTKLPVDGSSSYCWAHFKRIYIEGDF